MKNFVLGFVFALIAAAVAAYVYFSFGYAPVATAARPMPFERTLAHLGLQARMAQAAKLKAPILPDPSNLLAGASVYRDHCAMCHGFNGQPASAMAQGMFPPPPQLLGSDMVTDDAAGETYWKAANGIRLTGMPAFRNVLSDTQLWQVSLLLKNADRLPADVKTVLSQPAGK
jgi:thiosulfate dehydrogenase